jgi:hypothetical protein
MLAKSPAHSPNPGLIHGPRLSARRVQASLARAWGRQRDLERELRRRGRTP